MALALAACGGAPVQAPAEAAPAAAPSSAPKPAPARAETRSLRVLVAGDVIPHRPRLSSPERIGDALAPLKSLFSEAHAVVANHEGAVVSERDREHYEAIRPALVASPSWTRALAQSHIAAVTLANNHACDAGREGLERTMSTVDELGLVGIGADADDPFRPRVLAVSGGRRVCAIAWTALVNLPRSQCATSGKLAVAPFGIEGEMRIERAIKDAKSGACDALVAIGHAGEEYGAQVDGARAQARAAAAAGADAVVLHHPHVLSGIEVMTTDDGRRVPLFFSVGNLVSNQGESWHPGMAPANADRRFVARNAWTRLGMIADLTFRWEGDAPRPSLVWGYDLVWTDNDGAKDSAAIAARPLDPTGDRPIIAALERDAHAPERLFASPCWRAVGPGCR